MQETFDVFVPGPLPPLIPRPDVRVVPPGPQSRALARRLEQGECPEVTYLAPDFPIFWERAEGCMVLDVDGNTYLDLTAAFAVASVGHSHPEVVLAVQTQAPRLLHGMGDVHPSRLKVELAERLTEVVPGTLGQPLFATSGAEAVEAARKTCTIATGKPGILAFTGAYHGLTYGALELTARREFRAPFAAQRSGTVSHHPYPDCYRCPFGQEFPSCKLHCLTQLEQTLDAPGSGIDGLGGVLLEPIQGRGGTIVPPEGYLSGLQTLCRERGLLLILDEIYTGFGRTGHLFACEHEGVVPDLMAVGKALGGGLPISACVGTPEVMNRWPRSQGEAIHTSTFLGHPLACAAALKTLEILERDALTQRAAHLGSFLLERLQALERRHACIGQVRGRGLMVGIELVEDRKTKRPATRLCLELMAWALRQGLLVLPEGNHGNVLGLSPPLVIDEEQLELAVVLLDRGLCALTGRG